MLSLLLLNLQGAFMGYMASSSFFLALVVLIPTSVSFGGLWRARTADFQIQRLCFSGLSICNRYSPSTCVKAVVGHQVETITPCRRAWTGRSRTAISFSMGYGGGATNRYSWWVCVCKLQFLRMLSFDLCWTIITQINIGLEKVCILMMWDTSRV